MLHEYGLSAPLIHTYIHTDIQTHTFISAYHINIQPEGSVHIHQAWGSSGPSRSITPQNNRAKLGQAGCKGGIPSCWEIPHNWWHHQFVCLDLSSGNPFLLGIPHNWWHHQFVCLDLSSGNPFLLGNPPLEWWHHQFACSDLSSGNPAWISSSVSSCFLFNQHLLVVTMATVTSYGSCDVTMTS